MLPFKVRVDLTFKVEDFFGGSVYFKSEHLLTERYFHNPSFRGGVKKASQRNRLGDTLRQASCLVGKY